MANYTTSIIAGAAIADWFSIDLADVGTLDSVKIEIGKNGSTALDYRYPEAEGYPVLTKTDDSYSLSLTSAQTVNMRGLYEVEVTGTLNGQDVFKENYSKSAGIYLEVKSEIK